jgi:hypothetical protein
VCLDIISQHIPKIQTLIGDKKRPDYVCDAIGFGLNFSGRSIVARSKCIAIVDEVRKPFESGRSRLWQSNSANVTRPQVLEVEEPISPKKLASEVYARSGMFAQSGAGRGALKDFLRSVLHEPEACLPFKGDDRLTCHVISRFLSRRMHEEFGKGLDSSALCDRMVERHLISYASDEHVANPAAE